MFKSLDKQHIRITSKTISHGSNWTEILELFYPQVYCASTCFYLMFFIHQFTSLIQGVSKVVIVYGTVDNPGRIHFMFQRSCYKPSFTCFTLIDLLSPKMLFSFPSFNNLFTLTCGALYIVHHYFLNSLHRYKSFTCP